MKDAHCISAAEVNPFSTAQCDRQFKAICSWGLIVSQNHKRWQSSIYTDVETDGPTILTIPLIETANKITL
jgi:hypothetical protein